MKEIGITPLITGLLLGFYALTMDVSVKVNYSDEIQYGLPEKVGNLELISQRQNYVYISGVLFLSGIIILVFAKKPDVKPKHIYIKFQENGKKAEYKGQIPVAIDNFLEALYHLENDYTEKSMSKVDKESREKLIASLKEKVAELKSRQP